MLSNNKTMAWLSLKTDEEKSAILQAARSLVPKHRQLACQRRHSIQQYRAKKVKEQQERKERQRQRVQQQVQSATVALASIGGLWVTPDDVHAKLTGSNSQKREALKSQLRFRKLVMQQATSSNSRLFAFSQARRQLTVDELQQNLLELISDVTTSLSTLATEQTEGSHECDDDEDMLVGKSTSNP